MNLAERKPCAVILAEMKIYFLYAKINKSLLPFAVQTLQKTFKLLFFFDCKKWHGKFFENFPTTVGKATHY